LQIDIILKGTGLNDLEDAIITLADIMEIKGDPSGPVEAAIIESRIVRGKGYTYF
jgi:translation initiation factor IF-2